MKLKLSLNYHPVFYKPLLVMKLTAVLLLFAVMQVSAKSFGQEKLTFNLNNVEISSALSTIEKSTHYRFLYNSNLPSLKNIVSLSVKDAPLETVLKQLFLNTRLAYQLMDKNLVIIKEQETVNAFVMNADVKAIITGKVLDSSGRGLAGVSIQVKGTSKGTVSAADGSFSIDASSTDVLVVSYVGYETQEVAVGSNTTLAFSLKVSNSQLEQVVVVGYGTQRRRDLTGAVASVAGSELAKQPVQTPTQALQGKVAGVQIISSGQPNSLPTVRIRGTGSILAGANPLYVVDGVITDDIRNINSADIVSMDVLKDASATAIYGMRAANGVLIITTKKGRTGKMVISYDASAGVKEANHLVNMAGANQYANYINEANIYYGSGDSLITAAKLANGGNTDWFDAVLRRGLWQNHNVSLSGGSEKINYFLSAGYINEEGIAETNNFKRFTIRSNNEYKITDFIKVSTLISYSRASSHNIDLGVFNEAYRAAPYVIPERDGLYGNTSLSNNVGNPLVNLNKNVLKGTDNRVQSTVAIDINPVKWLTYRSSFGSDLDFYNNLNYAYQFDNAGDNSIFIDQGGNELRQKSSLTIDRNNSTRWVWDNTLTAVKSFDKHNFTLLVGTTAEEYTLNALKGSRTDVPADPNEWYLATGTSASVNNNNTGDKYHRNSYIGRLNYNFDERYLLTATFRADGTSKFASGNHWGYFPSVGVGWNITRETFMADQKVFNNLKIRGSYGKIGNDQIPSGSYLSLATINRPYFFGTTQNYGITFTQLPDPNVKWETTDEYDAGIEFAILNSRLSGEVDYYNKKVKDALININIPGTLPDADAQYTTNAASFVNKGVEAALNWKDRISTKLDYNLSANIAFNKNRVIGLNGGQALSDGGNSKGFVTRSDNGVPIGSFYVLQYDGIFQTEDDVAKSAQPNAIPGDIRYKDISGPDGTPDGVIDDFDRAFSGSYQPKITYGINGGISYMGFDINFGGYGTHGSKIYNGKKQSTGADPRDNIEAKVANNRWTPNNPNSGIPRASLNIQPNSTYFLENGDFFRINNLTLGYTLPQGVLSGIAVSRLRVYVTVQNLATFTKYSGFTPELYNPGDANHPAGSPLNAGIELNSYPTTRTFAFGVNLSF